MEKPTIEEHVGIIKGLLKLPREIIGIKCPYRETGYDLNSEEGLDSLSLFEKNVCPVCKGFIKMTEANKGCPCRFFGVEKAIEITKKQ